MNMNLENYLYSKGLSKSTVKHYHKHTLDFLAWLDGENTEAEQAGAGEVTAWLNLLKKKGQGLGCPGSHDLHRHFWRLDFALRAAMVNEILVAKLRQAVHQGVFYGTKAWIDDRNPLPPVLPVPSFDNGVYVRVPE